MNKYILTLFIILFSVGCTRKQQIADEGIPYYNYSEPEMLIIENDCAFLTDEQFNRSILDTTKMYKFDRSASIQLKKATYRLGYELAVRFNNESGMKLYTKLDSIDSNASFFCLGKLNLQTNVNSLIVLDYQEIIYDMGINLWLLNVKDNRLCSIVLLGSFPNINKHPVPSLSIKNNVLLLTSKETDYYLSEYFGDRFRYNIDIYSTFKINENGVVKFVKK